MNGTALRKPTARRVVGMVAAMRNAGFSFGDA